MPSLTAIYYTANVLSETFAQATRRQLLEALGDLPLISVSHKPMEFGDNYVFDGERSHFNIYRQALVGAKLATTPYIALCEDDVLYSKAHFEYQPSPGTFAYNMGNWNLFTWGDPVFTYKAPGGRKNLNGLICERELFIEAMEERFRLWPDDTNKSIFGEPGKYDNHLGTTPHPTEEFYVNPPNIVFSHESELSFEGLGKRKRPGQIRATEIPYWGRAETVRKLYV